MPYANPFGMTYDSGDYAAVLDRAAEPDQLGEQMSLF